ncbi:hypothetical protein DXG01_004054 [Tephrocybe rancida]|nr:hypothetical protein DXG01_004054 [Tephrocybe rancida]
MEQLFGINTEGATDCTELLSLLKSEIRIKQLRNKADTLRSIAREQTTTEPDGDTLIHVVLDRGGNESTREQDPFNKARVEDILQKVEIGLDLLDEQWTRVQDLICEYADVFALSLSKVLPFDWYKHKLNIDPEVKFPTCISQRPITEAQKTWFNEILDDMEKSHIVQKVPSSFIKALSSTNLAPKEAGKTGLTRVEILCNVNTECVCNGLPPFWEQMEGAGDPSEAMIDAVEGEEAPTAKKTKWRVCHEFNALNKATQVLPFPAGDLKAKQEFAAGHRWASVIDLAAGYYAVPLDDESVLYVAFYVEG